MFVILTQPRTGSELLTVALRDHPDLRVESELLNPKRYGHWRDRSFPGNDTIFDQTDDLAGFVDHCFTRVDGFKITYDQITHDSPVTALLHGKEHLKVVFLERDPLESAISHWFAATSKIWQRTEHVAVDDQPAEVPADYVQKFCAAARRDHSFYTALFQNHGCLTVRYVDLITNWHDSSGIVQTFLGVPERLLSKPFSKRLNKPLGELVTNLEELRTLCG